MRWHRQPDPAAVGGRGSRRIDRAGSPVPSSTPPRENHRLTAQELETQRIEREQATIAEGARRAEEMARAAKQAWEAERGAWCAANRIPREGSYDASRYLR